MKITKYGHACLVAEKDGKKLVIDPGELTELPEGLTSVSAVVITHDHFDHLYVEHLQKIATANPDVRIFAVESVLQACGDIKAEKQVVSADTQIEIGDFQVSFYYGDHAVVYKTPPGKNIGVKIDNELYYPGDSLRVIDEPVRAVGVPISAPWVKASEYIEFARAMNAKMVFPTHNNLLNEAGQATMNKWLQIGMEDTGVPVKIVAEGEVI